MYLEDFCKSSKSLEVFCIKRAGWKVTKTHAHLTFELKRF